MGGRIYQNVMMNRPGRSVFDLSYQKIFTGDMGKLYPVLCDEVVPGDVWQIGNEIVIRFMPLVAPILHEIYVTVHYFFVPYRLICAHPDIDVDWESFITGGEDGDDATVLPTWNVATNTVGSLWDYLGFPLGVDNANARPLIFPMAAYNMIWNDYYRDENVDAEVTVDTQETILSARWEKDYFTSALPWQQRGTSPAIPLSGTENVAYPGFVSASAFTVQGNSALIVPFQSIDEQLLEKGTIDFSAAGTFDIEDLRLAVRLQMWMERNARAGARLKEVIRSHFAVDVGDHRCERPEYIGGSKAPVIVSEVLQTSKTDGTALGTMGGHGISVQKNFCAKLRVPEHGLVMGIMCVRPRPVYHQGIDRQWLRETRYDFYWPEFAGLSEQAIETRELYCDAAHELTVFGYQGRYDEMRVKKSMVCGDMHSDYDHWHLCRQFSAQPTLNTAFVTCDPRKDIFAAPAEDGLLVSFGNIIRAVRPMPAFASPGNL